MAQLSGFNRQGGTFTQDQVSRSLQEGLLSLLGHSDQYGGLVVKLVHAHLFESDYRVIAERLIDFWHEYDKAPGAHTADLLADIIEDPDNKRAPTYRSILLAMEHTTPDLQPEFVLKQIGKFIRMQKLRTTIMTSAETVEAKGEHGVAEVEELLRDFLRDAPQSTTFDVGVRMSDHEHYFNHLAAREIDEFGTGIDLLDRHHIVPSRRTLNMLLASTGLGKSWWFIHLGKRAALMRKKVLHISLEMEGDAVMDRYVQSFRCVPALQDHLTTLRPRLKYDKDDSRVLSGVDYVKQVAPYSLKAPNSEDLYDLFDDRYHPRLSNILIKKFPQRSLTLGQLQAYLDMLAALPSPQRFEPDLLLIDYVGLMRIEGDIRNRREGFGQLVADLKRLAEERNIALATAHQINREGAKINTAKAHHVGDDWSMVQTADIILVLNRNEDEERAGLARIAVGKARELPKGQGIIIAQCYAHGMFCVGSAYAPAQKDYQNIVDGCAAAQKHPVLDEEVEEAG